MIRNSSELDGFERLTPYGTYDIKEFQAQYMDNYFHVDRLNSMLFGLTTVSMI